MSEIARPARAASSRWALWRLFRELTRRWHAGWDELPPDAYRRWVVTILVGCVIAAAATYGLVWAGKRMEAAGQFAWERPFMLSAEKRMGVTFYQGWEIGMPGGSLWLWPLMFLAGGIAVWMYRPVRALSFVVGYALVSLTTVFGWELWERPRPDFINGGVGVPGGWHSYPSGHVAHTVMVYGLFSWLWMRSSRSLVEKLIAVLVAAGMTLMVSVGRLRIGAHYPSDLVAGALIGAIWLIILIVALRRAERKF